MKLGWLAFVFPIGLLTITMVDGLQDSKVIAPIEKDKFFKIAVISDLNSGYGSTIYHPDVAATLKELDSIKPDMILCAGDMVAGQKLTLTEQNLAEMWQSFNINVLTPIKAMRIPFGFTVGNHDASPNFAKDRQMTKRFWNENQNQLGLKYVDQTNFPFYYSYSQNDVFFISWDAAGALVQADVFKWMQDQLNSEKAKKAKLRIVLGHLPIYAIVDSKNKPGEVLAATQQILDFFKQNKVDLYISGHQHAYYPVKEDGLRLLNTGCIGEGPRQLIGDLTAATRAYTIIEIPIKDYKNFSYRTFIPKKKTEIKLANLPDSVVGFNGVSRRELN
jgi:predicted MPP superfamily phosphohydrolase